MRGSARVCVAFGTRPEAIKMAPVVHALRAAAGLEPVVLVSGQHREQLDAALRLFGITPERDLGVMQPQQTLPELLGRTVPAAAAALRALRPDFVLVHGDTLTTFAVALAAFYEGLPVGHLWSVWVGFRGGKGLATTLGTALPLYPLGGLCSFGVLMLLTLLWRARPGGVDRAVFVTAALYPALVYLSLRGAPTPVALTFALSAALIALAVALKHLLAARTPRP